MCNLVSARHPGCHPVDPMIGASAAQNQKRRTFRRKGRTMLQANATSRMGGETMAAAPPPQSSATLPLDRLMANPSPPLDRLAPPPSYTVRAGDTLSKIAERSAPTGRRWRGPTESPIPA
jgi:nucleoid-associated protein YgaU